MSGGSMGYIYAQVNEWADCMGDPELVDLMHDVAELLHDREWYLSSDYGRGAWLESVRKFKKKWFEDDREERLKKYVDKIFETAKNKCYEMIGGTHEQSA